MRPNLPRAPRLRRRTTRQGRAFGPPGIDARAPGRTTMTAMRSTPPFRADHVGSLLRPPELHAAQAARGPGEIPHAQLRAAEDERSARRCGEQEEIGLAAVTDGEFRRAPGHLDFLSRNSAA